MPALSCQVVVHSTLNRQHPVFRGRDLDGYSRWYSRLSEAEKKVERVSGFENMPDISKQHILDIPKLHPDIRKSIK